jgi:hypothetical protein
VEVGRWKEKREKERELNRKALTLRGIKYDSPPALRSSYFRVLLLLLLLLYQMLIVRGKYDIFRAKAESDILYRALESVVGISDKEEL